MHSGCYPNSSINTPVEKVDQFFFKRSLNTKLKNKSQNTFFMGTTPGLRNDIIQWPLKTHKRYVNATHTSMKCSWWEVSPGALAGPGWWTRKKNTAKRLRGERKTQGGHETKTDESNNYLVSVITIRYFAGRWTQKMKNGEAFQDKQSSLNSARSLQK